MRKLNKNKINNKKTITISLAEALKDVIPIKWSDAVISGKRKIVVSKVKESKSDK